MELPDNLYKTIFNITNDAIIVVSTGGKIIELNDAAPKLLGYKKEDIVGMSIKDLSNVFPAKTLAIVLKNFGLRMMGKEIEPYEVELRHSDGKIIHVRLNAVLMKKNGKTVANIASIQDLTSYKKLIDKLKNKNEELEKFNEIAINREIKMVELKKKIVKLENKLENKTR